ncbi:MAG: hypothetical protein JO182_32960 [Acidobacteriaceae bacterium]|nr:hypothetical protein [Acidobacteriaceae bacterium]MBV9305952.1 hypothetical protein [Acidobacteriaceae bacterium]
MPRNTGSYWLLGAVLLTAVIQAQASDSAETGLMILVYNYAGVDNQTLVLAEIQVGQILRQAGIELNWRRCDSAAKPSLTTNCPDMDRTTPALRLVSHFRLVPDHVHTDTLGFSIGNIMTVSSEKARNLAQTGVGQLSEILGVVIAHEFGHLLLGGAHSASGVMRARLDLSDWALAQQGWLVFHPAEAAALRKAVRDRTETLRIAHYETPISQKFLSQLQSKR